MGSYDGSQDGSGLSECTFMVPILFLMLNSMSGYWSWDAMVVDCLVCCLLATQKLSLGIEVGKQLHGLNA
jgi:hypothetical protein